MATTTTNFGFTKPGVNDPIDANQWGTQLNADLDSLDSLLKKLSVTGIGSTRPTYADAGTLWVNNSTNPWILYIYDGTNDIQIGTIDTTTNTFTPSSGGTVTQVFLQSDFTFNFNTTNNLVPDLTFTAKANTKYTIEIAGTISPTTNWTSGNIIWKTNSSFAVGGGIITTTQFSTISPLANVTSPIVGDNITVTPITFITSSVGSDNRTFRVYYRAVIKNTGATSTFQTVIDSTSTGGSTASLKLGSLTYQEIL